VIETGELTLAALVGSDPPPTGPQVLDIAVSLAELLAGAHRDGHVHGAVRAENVVASPDVRLLPPDPAADTSHVGDQMAFGGMLHDLFGDRAPAPVAAVVARAEAGQFADLGEVAAALRAAQRELGYAPATEVVEPPGPAATNRAPLVLALVLVALLGGLGVLLVRGEDDDPQVAPAATTTTELPLVEYIDIEDETGVLTVSVPSAWSDVDGRTADLGPAVAASTDLDRLRAFDYTVPGLVYAAIEADAHPEIDPDDPDAVLDELLDDQRSTGRLVDVCESDGRADYRDTLYTGRIERLTGCNGEGDVIIIVAAPVSRAYAVIVEVHLPAGDDTGVLERIQETFVVSGFP
jgi:hypothetical protein